jgi:hypothetical protein
MYAKVAGKWSKVYPPVPQYNDATGGTVTDYMHPTLGVPYRAHTIRADETFTVTKGDRPFEYIVVAGGGGGGSRGGGCGGGGAGGLLTETKVLPVGAYPVVIGKGGKGATDTALAQGANGSDTTAFGLTVKGGGGGGGYNVGAEPRANGLPGGSGGGAGRQDGVSTGGAGTAGQGFDGGGTPSGNSAAQRFGAGGGGARGAGGAPNGAKGARGDGLVSSLSGVPVMYAQGGEGSWADTNLPADGGGRGGGSDAAGTGGNGAPGVNGGGGGGAGGFDSSNPRNGGDGGRGVVVVGYELDPALFVPPVFNDATGGAVTEYTKSDGTRWRVHTLTAAQDLFTVTNSVKPWRYLACAGGGNGPGGGNNGGGGGGAGGLLTGEWTPAELPVTAYPVAVGRAAQNTVVNGLTLIAGGGGGASYSGGGSGGSGGGAGGTGGNGPPDAIGGGGGTPGQGNGGSGTDREGTRGGGGGGGAGGGGGHTGGASGGSGGAPLMSDITGTNRPYASGGAGTQTDIGGGGPGSTPASDFGGGGGAGRGPQPGVVIVSYEIENPGYNEATGGAVTEYDEVLTRTKIVGLQFATDTAPITASNTHATVAAVNGHMALTKVNDPGGGAASAQMSMAATPGQTFTLSVDVENPSAFGGTIALIALDSTGKNIKNEQTQINNKDGHRAVLSSTMPAGTVDVRVRVLLGTDQPNGAVVKFGNLLLESGDVPNATWFDGATGTIKTGKRFRVHRLTAAQDLFTVLKNPKPFRYLVCAGGGGGGGSNNAAHGGAGGGGKVAKDDAATLPLGPIPVGVGTGGGGGGGNGGGGNGNPSSLGSIATAAGGSGGPPNQPGGMGAAGGGANLTSNITGTDAVYGQDAPYFNAGGGAGASGPGGGGGPGAVGTNSGGAGQNGVVIVSYEVAP